MAKAGWLLSLSAQGDKLSQTPLWLGRAAAWAEGLRAERIEPYYLWYHPPGPLVK